MLKIYNYENQNELIKLLRDRAENIPDHVMNAVSGVLNSVRSEGDKVWVRPRCPYCHHVEQSDWNLIPFFVPTMQHSKKTNGYTCKNCRRSFTISVYPG